MKNERGQVAIFVIVALVIVGAIVAVWIFPGISNIVAPQEVSPEGYLEDCLAPEVKGAVDLLSKQGGSQNPPASILYDGNKVEYLCYASGYYNTCVVQQPLLISHFGKELSRILTPKAEQCARNLIAEYDRKGYSVSSSKASVDVSVVSDGVKVEFSAPMTVTRGEVSRTFDKFDITSKSELYEILSIATSIIDYETTYGDSETTSYLRYYPNLKIEKIKLEDGIKIYRLSDVVSNEMFQFATRSLAWPPGYGL